MKNILVTGANGQLGRALQESAESASGFRFFFTDIDTLDITSKEAIVAYMEENRIQGVINAAAYTAVDQAESEINTAYHINAYAVRNLGAAAYERRIRLIHISTDYVFDGMNHRPYLETDGTRPMSAYGRTKLSGEVMLQEACPDAIIIRTSWLYSKTGNNFVQTMLRLGKEKEEIRVVFDQIGSPTYVGDLVGAIFAIMERSEKGAFVPGIFHFSNEGVCSWYDFAHKIMELARLRCRVIPIETKDYPTPAARPSYSVLNKAKIKETYNITIPHWEESLKKVIINN